MSFQTKVLVTCFCIVAFDAVASLLSRIRIHPFYLVLVYSLRRYRILGRVSARLRLWNVVGNNRGFHGFYDWVVRILADWALHSTENATARRRARGVRYCDCYRVWIRVGLFWCRALRALKANAAD